MSTTRSTSISLTDARCRSGVSTLSTSTRLPGRGLRSVIAAYDESVKAAPVTEVLCLNDNPDIREKSSPCIRFTDHEGDHRDNTGGEWMQ
jgi:hypothetical protein